MSVTGSDIEPRAYTAHELAQAWKVSARHVYGLMEQGVLPYFQIGRCRRVLAAHVHAYERDNTHRRASS